MESAKSSADIQAHIAALQREFEIAKKRESHQAVPSKIRAPGSPDPKSRHNLQNVRREDQAALRTTKYSSSAPRDTAFRVSTSIRDDSAKRLSLGHQPKPSDLTKAISTVRKTQRTLERKAEVVRSITFEKDEGARTLRRDKGENFPEERDSEEAAPGTSRHDDLTLVEDLQPGPKEFTAPIGDPSFERLEPNSQIRLRSRILPHALLQDHLTDRYHVSPSQLYSIVRPSRKSGELDVPVIGDWIIIGVLAEKSDIKVTNQRARPVQDGTEEDLGGGEGTVDGPDDEVDSRIEPKVAKAPKAPKQPENQRARRYITFKLLDLGRRGAGGGDGILQVHLFESDSHSTNMPSSSATSKATRLKSNAKLDTSTTQDTETEVQYRGGSGGAYERFWKENDGAVVAILNPRIMRPHSFDPRKPTSTVIALTPENAKSMLVIGRALDLGRCPALRANGKECGSWMDTRVSRACEYHVQQAVKKQRSGRSELLSGTSGLVNHNMGAKQSWKKKPLPGSSTKPDYVSETGLLPATNQTSIEGITTYVCQGGGNDRKQRGKRKFFDSPLDRQKLDGDERKRKRQEDENEIKRLLDFDRGKSVGSTYLRKARRALRAQREESPETPDPADPAAAGTQGGNMSVDADDLPRPSRRTVFTANCIRNIGFDPTAPRTSEEARSSQRDRSKTANLLATIELLHGRHSNVVKERKSSSTREVKVSARGGSEGCQSESEDDDLIVEGGPVHSVTVT